MTRQRGFSLIEMMIGLAIGLLILTVLSALLVNSSKARVDLDQSMQQVENGRYATQLLGDEIRHAGYYGEGQLSASAPASLPDPCDQTVAGMIAALPLAVQGYSQPASNPLSACLNSANVVAGQDILVVRRAQTVSLALASLDPTGTYVQSLGAKVPVLDVGSNTGKFNLTTKSGAAANIHPYAIFAYFISPCDVPAGGGSVCTGSGDDNGNPIPTLKRLELTANTSKVVTLVQGVQEWRVQYGVDSNQDGTPDNGTSDGNYTAPATVGDWANVMAVRIDLLARNTQKSGGYKDTKTYVLGDPTSPVGPFYDQYKRHTYSGTFRLMGASGNRER